MGAGLKVALDTSFRCETRKAPNVEKRILFISGDLDKKAEIVPKDRAIANFEDVIGEVYDQADDEIGSLQGLLALYALRPAPWTACQPAGGCCRRAILDF